VWGCLLGWGLVGAACRGGGVGRGWSEGEVAVRGSIRLVGSWVLIYWFVSENGVSLVRVWMRWDRLGVRLKGWAFREFGSIILI